MHANRSPKAHQRGKTFLMSRQMGFEDESEDDLKQGDRVHVLPDLAKRHYMVRHPTQERIRDDHHDHLSVSLSL